MSTRKSDSRDHDALQDVTRLFRNALIERDRLREVLEWVATNYESTLAGRAVRDADECLLAAHNLTKGQIG